MFVNKREEISGEGEVKRCKRKTRKKRRIKTTGGGFSLEKEGVTPNSGWERSGED